MNPPDPLIFRIYPHASPAYQMALALRTEILRTPLGLHFSPADLAGEDAQFHWGAFDQAGNLLATLILLPMANGIWKMRQVAVAAALQGQGLGRKLVTTAEAWLLSQGQGGKTVQLHARAAVIPFYEKLGYTASGPEFTEITLPHRHMEKRLEPI